MNAITSSILDNSAKLYVVLDQAAKAFETNPQSASAFDAPIAAVQLQLAADNKASRNTLIGILSLGSAFCLCFGTACVLSFSFVSRLRARKLSFLVA